jgi:hypothetical protein
VKAKRSLDDIHAAFPRKDCGTADPSALLGMTKERATVS